MKAHDLRADLMFIDEAHFLMDMLRNLTVYSKGSVLKHLAILGRWKAKNPTKRTPSLRTDFDDGVYGVVKLGDWFNHRKKKANGNAGSLAVQARSQKLLMNKITSVLKLATEPDWWRVTKKEG